VVPLEQRPLKDRGEGILPSHLRLEPLFSLPLKRRTRGHALATVNEHRTVWRPAHLPQNAKCFAQSSMAETNGQGNLLIVAALHGHNPLISSVPSGAPGLISSWMAKEKLQ
jgi:hypothetical protein